MTWAHPGRPSSGRINDPGIGVRDAVTGERLDGGFAIPPSRRPSGSLSPNDAATTSQGNGPEIALVVFTGFALGSLLWLAKANQRYYARPAEER